MRHFALLIAALMTLSPAFAGDSPEALIEEIAATRETAKEANRRAAIRKLIDVGITAAPGIQKAMMKTTDARAYAQLAYALSRLDTQVSDETLRAVLGRTLSKDIPAEFMILEAADRMFRGQADRDSVFEETTLQDKTRCTVSRRRFDILLTHPNSPADARPTTLAWVRAEQLLPVGFDSLRFDHHLAFVDKAPGAVCDKTQALRLRDNLVAVFLRDEDKTNGDSLAVIYVNPIDRRVVASRADLGPIGKPVVEARGEEILFESALRPTDAADCEGGKCPKVDGNRPTRIRDERLPYWNRVTLDKETVRARVDRDITWERTPLKKFFADRAHFEKAFRWNDKEGRYDEASYRLAELADGKKHCLVPGRELPRKGWICR